jgi:hypothetical protein
MWYELTGCWQLCLPSKAHEPVTQSSKTASVVACAGCVHAAKIDDWRRQQSDVPNVSEAIRRLVEIGLEASSKGGTKKKR